MGCTPWGDFEVLYSGKDCKVKRILVEPKQRMSYQSHEKRSELWLVISGEGSVILDEKESSVGSNAILGIPQGIKHRISNTSEEEDLVFIEIQTGTYFGEDDITRYEDDYGRHRENWYKDDDLD